MKFVQTIRTFFGKDGLVSSFKTLNVSQKIMTCVALGGGMVAGIAEGVCYMKDIESGFKSVKRYAREFNEERGRSKMIGTDVAHGLAWSHYCGFLRYVLPEFEEKIKANEWYKNLKEKDKQNLPMKLFELIPRKYYTDIIGNDDKIKEVSTIAIEVEHTRTGIKKEIRVPIYSIQDGDKTYFCLFDCPDVLKTINTVHDVQLAGISRSKVPLFNVDLKLVQLMRFYFALSCFKCIDVFGKKAKLVLFNESDKKLSDVLLEAIKEDLNSSIGQKTRGSLMENKLMSAEERKDICYDFDCFVTHSKETTDENLTKRIDKISGTLKTKDIKVLLEKDCLGKDWLEKMKYAATQCRWLVFMDEKNSECKQLIDSNVVSSLKGIIESRKVQTVAIVDKTRKQEIHDDLRCVTCIPDGDNDDYLTNTLYKVVSGADVNLEKKTDLCLKPGDAVVGLAWGYAVDDLNHAISKIGNRIDTVKSDINEQLILKNKLFIVVPKGCNAKPSFEDFTKHESQKISATPSTDNTHVYKLDESKYVVVQYASPVSIICHMHISGLVDHAQMESEADEFYIALDNIMRILFPEKAEFYEFIHFDGKQTTTLKDVLSERVK